MPSAARTRIVWPAGDFFELLEARHALHRDADRDAKRDKADNRKAKAPAEDSPDPDAKSGRRVTGRAVPFAGR